MRAGVEGSSKGSFILSDQLPRRNRQMRPGSPHESPQGLKRERKYLMQRKILAICAALVALGALAIAPTMVSAATLKDTSGGVVTTLAAGAKITAYSTGTALFKGSGLTVE